MARTRMTITTLRPAMADRAASMLSGNRGGIETLKDLIADYHTTER